MPNACKKLEPGRNSFQSYIVISACGQGWNLMALMCPSIENKSALQNGLLCMCIDMYL